MDEIPPTAEAPSKAGVVMRLFPSLREAPGNCLRGSALFLAVFSVVNIVASWRESGFDPNLWWIDFFLLPPAMEDVLLLVAAGLLFAYALWPGMTQWRLRATLGLLALLVMQAIGNAAVFFVLLWRGVISSSLPVPFSALVAVLLVAIGLSARRAAAKARQPGRLGVLAGAMVAAAVFPLLQACLYGHTDYRRPADAILVFGARTFADGQPSDALADRVRTGVELYQQGLAPRLIMSGGPGDGATHETEAMREMAIGLGVPESAIIVDRAGVNTEASVRNIQRLGAQQGFGRILAVSHYWHLPRIKLAAGRRAASLYTVPAYEERPLRHTPRMLLRETAAFWAYYARLVLMPR